MVPTMWSVVLQSTCYNHGAQVNKMQCVQAWYISRITRECLTDSLLTTHAHYIGGGGGCWGMQGKGVVGQLGTLLSCTTCVVSTSYLVDNHTT